jgi:zinc transporter ZupT
VDIDTPTASTLLTVAGLTVAVTILVEVIKRAAALSEAQVSRWGALLAVGVGVLLALITYVALAFDGSMDVTGGAIVQVFLTGLLAGAAAGGIYKSQKATTGGQ